MNNTAGIISIGSGFLNPFPVNDVPINKGCWANSKKRKITAPSRIILFGGGKANANVIIKAVYTYIFRVNRSSNIYTERMAAAKPTIRQMTRI
jgi:hypothetical protein